MITYPWKCTVLHCNHLGNTWKPLVLMTQHFDYCPSTSEPGDNQSVRSSAPVVSRCFPGGHNVKLYISRGRLAWWLLAFLHSGFCNNNDLWGRKRGLKFIEQCNIQGFWQKVCKCRIVVLEYAVLYDDSEREYMIYKIEFIYTLIVKWLLFFVNGSWSVNCSWQEPIHSKHVTTIISECLRKYASTLVCYYHQKAALDSI